MVKFLYLWLFCCIIVGVAPSHNAWAGIFGTQEVRSNDISIFTKWTDVLNRMKSDAVVDERQCNASTSYCYYGGWQKFVASIKRLPRLEQLKRVQAYANERRYITDPINWQVPDYWATPRQFFMKEGDCEDYAIIKFMTLRKLGITNKQMRIVVLNDENLKALHAVLAVTIGGTTYMLDNQIDEVVPQSSIHHYRPIYSINEKSWWRHI